MELNGKKIIFCFPYRGAGGVPLLFLRLANYISLRGYDVALVDYVDGYMAQNNSYDIELIEYYDDKEAAIPKDAIVIFQMMTPWSIYPSLRLLQDTVLFFIATIPVNFYPLLPVARDLMSHGGVFSKVIWHTILKDEYTKVQKFTNIALEKKSLVFLDEDVSCNIRNNMDIDIPDPVILPLFSDSTEGNRYLDTKHMSNDELVLGWVGRIADFKVHILNRVIDDLQKYSLGTGTKIKFIIIGEGDREGILKVSAKNTMFKIVRIKHIRPDKLPQTLLTFDLLFAMGTSALDGARLGVPTVRLDYSFKEVGLDYKYKFFYDVKGYSMGELIDSKCYHRGLRTMDDIISKLLNDKIYLSEKTFAFYEKHHSLESSADKFLEYLGRATLKYDDVTQKHLHKSKLYDVWKNFRGRR